MKKKYKKFLNWSNEDLINEIIELKESQKLGLVWETDKEQIVEECKNKFPILKLIKKNNILKNRNKPTNLFIEGDNYHSLSVFNYTHQKKIDFIYIDPPYNTGAKDWKYNNDYVDKEDSYKHSKWLSMMNSRLKLSKNLLKQDGVICVTIDNHEVGRLILLLDEIFGSDNFLGEVIIRNNPASRNVEGKIALTHEYALFYGRSKNSKIGKINVAPENKTHTYVKDKNGNWYNKINLRKTGVDNSGINKKGNLHHRHYPIYVDVNKNLLSTSIKYKNVVYPINTKGEKVIWRRSKEEVNEMFKRGDCWAEENKNGIQIYIKFFGGLDGESPKSIWMNPLNSASEHGTPELERILGKKSDFPFPKSKHAVKECIKIGCSNKNGIVLDFFAGSATTAQAVLELNEEDNQNRTFIVCTNNENNVATETAYPRIRNVINGFKDKPIKTIALFEKKIDLNFLNNADFYLDEIETIKEENKKKFSKLKTIFLNGNIALIGITENQKIKKIEANLNYYKTELIDGSNSDKNKYDISKLSVDMLCLKENTFEEVLRNNSFYIYKNSEKCVGILLDTDKINLFKKELIKLNSKICLYIFSLDDDNYEDEFSDIKNVHDCLPVPEGILKLYRSIFRK